ncbi:hypothetical protein BGZ82_004132 [Podila clonocystis]|nr:hypothetical protein BGZ82_004132 [Podila clonocystis]
MTDGNLVLLFSNPFPTSFKSAKWELLAKLPAKEIFSNANLDPNNYSCAASKDGAFMILSREPPSTESIKIFIVAVADTSSNGWEMVKFSTGICLQEESCWGQLLATPAGSSAPFMLVVQHLREYVTDTNRTLNFLTYMTGINHFMEQPTAFDVQRSNKRGDNFEFLGNQFGQLYFAWPEGNTTIVDNTTITTTLFDLDTQGLPDPTRQSNNATMTNLRCPVENNGSLSGNSVLYFVCEPGDKLARVCLLAVRQGSQSVGQGSPSDLSTGGIVGIAVGAVALVVIAGFAVRNWRRRLKNKKRDVELSKIGSRT